MQIFYANDLFAVNKFLEIIHSPNKNRNDAEIVSTTTCRHTSLLNAIAIITRVCRLYLKIVFSKRTPCPSHRDEERRRRRFLRYTLLWPRLKPEHPHRTVVGSRCKRTRGPAVRTTLYTWMRRCSITALLSRISRTDGGIRVAAVTYCSAFSSTRIFTGVLRARLL